MTVLRPHFPLSTLPGATSLPSPTTKPSRLVEAKVDAVGADTPSGLQSPTCGHRTVGRWTSSSRF